MSLLVGALSFRAVTAADRLRDAEDLIDRAVAALENGELAKAQTSLERAESLIVDANGRLRGPDVGLASLVPGLRDNILAVEESVDLAAVVVHGGASVLQEARPLQGENGRLEVTLSDGSIPLGALQRARSEIATLLADLQAREQVHDSPLLLGEVAELRDAVVGQANERVRQLDVLNRGLTLLEEIVGANGPRRYLIAVANTAEMRGSGGMILNYGVLEGRDGTVTLPEFGRIDELALATPVSSSVVPEDYLARWQGFDPLSRWRQANLAADFTVVAPVLEAMYEQATLLPVDGVIQIDPDGLAALLAGVGPISVPELGVVDETNVVDLTLHDAYVLFPGVEDRSDVLGDVAEAAFRRLVEGDIPSLRTLAGRLVEAVDGHHVLMHSTNASLQRQSRSFGADGALSPIDGPDSFSLTAQNLSGNKLDYFLETRLDLSGDRPVGETGSLEARATLANTAAPDATTPAYIYGRGADGRAVGSIRTLVTLYLPFGTSLVATSGDELVEPAVSGTEAGRPYASFLIDLPAGATKSVVLSMQLAPRPDTSYEAVLVPSPRVRPTRVTVDIDTGQGTVDADVVLDRTWVVATGAPPVAQPAPAFE